jgi:addiction module RelB/DinJ family antitoxin
MRSAIIQARVRPEIKFAAERVLHGLGLTMTDLMELVLRRLIVDQKLPLEPVALNDAQLTAIITAWEGRGTIQVAQKRRSRTQRPHKREQRE